MEIKLLYINLVLFTGSFTTYQKEMYKNYVENRIYTC